MYINREYLAEVCQPFGISFSGEMLEQFDKYGEFLARYNEDVNLTAITQPDEMVVKHFLDSLLLMKAVDLGAGVKLVDVGPGGGFPSVPVKIVEPDLDLTLLDSLRKRVRFLEQLSELLGQDNNCVHMRAEEAGKYPDYRERFDVATARAVAELPVLSEYCLPLVKVGGVFAAMKGYDCEDELERAERAIRELGGQVKDVVKYRLPDDSGRAIVLIEKRSQTPTKFPRNAAKITKKPL